MLLHESIVHSFVFLNSSPLYRQTTIYLFIHPLMGIWVTLSPWEVWVAVWPISCPYHYWQWSKRWACQSEQTNTDCDRKQTSLRWHQDEKDQNTLTKMYQDDDTVQIHTKKIPRPNPHKKDTKKKMLHWEYCFLSINCPNVDNNIFGDAWRTGNLIHCWWEHKMERNLEIPNFCAFILYPAIQIPGYTLKI